MIWWLCPKPDGPSGGVWFIHKLAYLLDKNGIHSMVKQVESFNLWWPAIPIPEYIVSQGRVFWPRDDEPVIIPEVLWHDNYERFKHPVCFVQNCLWLDHRIPMGPEPVFVCSRHLANLMKREYKANVVGIVRAYVDYVEPAKDERPIDVFLFSRRNDLGDTLARKLGAQGLKVHLQNQPISQKTVAQLLASSKFYVHTVTPEGWPQICLEAMAHGTVVVGTPGGGGSEFMFHKETAWVTQDPSYGRISSDEMVQQILEGVATLRASRELYESIQGKALAWSGRYTEAATTQELLKVVKCLTL